MSGTDADARDPGRDLLDAIAAGELRLAFQPEFDLTTDTVAAVEALSRWRHPRRGELDPSAFIAAAERDGSVRRLGMWTMRTALGARSAWQAAIPDLDVVLRVNVSPCQLLDPDLAADLRAQLGVHGIDGRQVCIEITEREPLGDLHALAEAIARLRDAGVACALDDLASGYSTLGALRALPVDAIKIDRSMVSGIDADARAAAIVTHIVRMASDLGATAVAEGVENERELHTLRALGCTRVQGHLLGRPMDVEQMTTLLTERGRRTGQG